MTHQFPQEQATSIVAASAVDDGLCRLERMMGVENLKSFIGKADRYWNVARIDETVKEALVMSPKGVSEFHILLAHLCDPLGNFGELVNGATTLAGCNSDAQSTLWSTL